MSRDIRLRLAGSFAGLGSAFIGFGFALGQMAVLGVGIAFFFVSYIIDARSVTNGDGK